MATETKKARMRLAELQHRYGELCAQIGHFIVHHLLFEPTITEKMVELHNIAKEQSTLELELNAKDTKKPEPDTK